MTAAAIDVTEVAPRRARRRRSETLATHAHWWQPGLYLAPFAIGLAVFTLFPIVNVFFIAVRQDYQLLNQQYDGYGLRNFSTVLSDRYFTSSLKNTAVYVLTVVPASTVLSLFFANLLNQRLRGSAFFQTAFFLPMITSVVAVGLAWKWMFNFDYGLINFLLERVGASRRNWLNDPSFNLLALIIYGTWSTLPFTIIILLAGLQNIDPIYAHAAAVDGASRRRIFFRITLPLLAPTIGLVLVVNTISSSKVFAELFPLWNGKPGAAYNLYTVVYYIYDTFYVKWRLGPAGAAAVIFLAFVLALTALQALLQRLLRWW